MPYAALVRLRGHAYSGLALSARGLAAEAILVARSPAAYMQCGLPVFLAGGKPNHSVKDSHGC